MNMFEMNIENDIKETINTPFPHGRFLIVLNAGRLSPVQLTVFFIISGVFPK